MILFSYPSSIVIMRDYCTYFKQICNMYEVHEGGHLTDRRKKSICVIVCYSKGFGIHLCALVPVLMPLSQWVLEKDKSYKQPNNNTYPLTIFYFTVFLSVYVCLFMYTASVTFDYYCRDSELSYIEGDWVPVYTSFGGSWGL